MSQYRAGFLLYFFVWLMLVLVPASWAVLTNGGYEWLADSLSGLSQRFFAP